MSIVPIPEEVFEGYKRECDRLRQLCKMQQQEIENLRGMADAVEVLRDIGKVFGCGHVDDPDGRRQLTNCIEQEFSRVRNECDLLQDERTKLAEALNQFCECNIAGGRAWDEKELYQCLHKAWRLLRTEGD